MRSKTIERLRLEALSQMDSGDSIYMEIDPQKVTSYASHAGIKITTEQCLIIEGKNSDPIIKKVIKVTKR